MDKQSSLPATNTEPVPTFKSWFLARQAEKYQVKGIHATQQNHALDTHGGNSRSHRRQD